MPIWNRQTAPIDGSRLKVAILGANSHIAGEAHLPHLLANPAVEVAVLQDVSVERVEALRAKLGRGIEPPEEGARFVQSCLALGRFDDHDRLAATLVEADVQAVVVCTPNELHHPMAKAVLLAGLHVLCEKPLAVNAPLAFDLASLAEEREVILMCGFHLPWVLASGVGRIINQYVGGVNKAQAVWKGKYRHVASETYAHAGALVDIGLHPTIVVMEALGWPDVIGVEAEFGYERPDPRANEFGLFIPENFDGETSAEVTVTLANGVKLRIEAAYVAPIPEREIVYVKLDAPYANGAEIPFMTQLTDRSDYQPTITYLDGGVRVTAKLDTPRGLREEDFRAAQSRHWVHLCRAEGPDCCPEYEQPVYITGRNAAVMMQIADAAQQSAAEGGRWTPVTA